MPRGFQAVRVTDKSRAHPLIVAHFHGLRDGRGKQDTPERAQQAKRAITLLSQMANPKNDIVLSGDFNVLPDGETLAIFAAWGLRDLVGTTDTRTQLYAKPVRQANYMLVTDRVQVTSLDIPTDPIVSDHRPMIFDIA